LLPQDVVTELKRLTEEIRKGSSALYEAEVKLAHCEHELDTVEQTAFIRSEGTVADRNALSKLESSQERLQRDLAKAELNRIRMKVKGLESAVMATQTMSRLLEMEARL
jgi:hypothetical protein